MKSISEVTGNVVRSFEKGTQVALAGIDLPPRLAPLETADIEKLDAAIGRSFIVERKPVYGYLAIRDEAGDIIRTEYDVVAKRDSYTPKAEVPNQLRDALLRPAERRHIIFHLTRLAAHRRDTRGKEALTAVLEDIALDLDGVSEWAIVLACREMRQKDTTWYPTTGEILKIILENDDRMRHLFSKPSNAPQIMSEKRNQLAAPISRHEKPKDKWTEQDWADHIGDAEAMLRLAEQNPTVYEPAGWVKEVEKRTAERAAALNGGRVAQNSAEGGATLAEPA